MGLKANINGGTCFLSPHSDDLVMSGFFIIKEEILPRPYYLFTVFGESEYVDVQVINNYDKKEITDIRLAEDREFAKSFDLNFLFLKEPDCLKRFNCAIFNDLFPINEILLQHIYTLILQKTISLNISNFVVPYPFGKQQHYDHRILCEIGKKLSITFGSNLFYLDDIPYSVADLSPTSIDVFFKKMINDLDIKVKYNAMEIYKSQMCNLYYERVKLLNQERLFTIK